MNRRTFIRSAAGAGAVAALASARLLKEGPAPAPESGPGKLLIVQFGGGTRSIDTIDDPEHRYIPRLWDDLIPNGVLFTNMRVEHKVVHPNSTGSMMTGHWEWDDIDWSKPVAHPTIFEIFRKARRKADTSAWAFVYASILAKTGESTADGYGREFAANVMEPPTIPRSTSDEMDRVMYHAAADGSADAEILAARKCAALAKSTSRISYAGLRSKGAQAFGREEYNSWRCGTGSTSHDEFLTDRAIACMKRFAPDIIAVDYGEIDCAHYGSWSRYADAIRRTDELTWRLWQTVNALSAYKGNTLMLILPDHGRELEESGGWGFVHHSDFYTNKGADEGCRRVWMLALGPGVRKGGKLSRAVPITTAAATGLEFLGLDASRGAAESVLGRLG